MPDEAQRKTGAFQTSIGGNGQPPFVSRTTRGLLNPAPRQSVKSNGPNGSSGFSARIREAALQADTVARAATNFLTFNTADNLEAANAAFFEPGGLKGYRQRYQAALAQQKRRNQYDATQRQRAVVAGAVLGAGLGFATTRRILISNEALNVAPRIAGTAGLTGHDLLALTGAGALTGYAAQRASDVLTGQASTQADMVGAMLGGAAGTASRSFGPGMSGATDAAVTSMAQDMFNGRPVSASRTAQSAVAGYGLGKYAGNSAGEWSNNLSPLDKGKLGERLGSIRRQVNGYPSTMGARKTRDTLRDETGKFSWNPDDRSGDLRFEYKFGSKNDLSENQKRAQPLLGANFELYHFLPSDIAKAASVPAGSMAPILVDQARDRRR